MNQSLKTLQLVPPSVSVPIHICVTSKDTAIMRAMVDGARGETFEHPLGDSSSSTEGTEGGNLIAFESVTAVCENNVNSQIFV